MATPTRRKSADERREDILAVAMERFAQVGYHGTSTEDIAAGAGISQPYLFRLFGTKKALFLACDERACDRVLDAFRRAAENAPGETLEALGRAYYNSGQHERSRVTFEQLLELDPSAHYAHFALGQSLKQLGRRTEARTHLRLAVALSPTSEVYAGALARLGPPKKT